MATLYPRPDFSRQEQGDQVFSYSVPDYYCYEPCSAAEVSRHTYSYSDSIPRSMFINPQHLMVDLPASPQPPAEYCVQQIQQTIPIRGVMEERSPAAYASSTQRRRPTQRSFSHGQIPKSGSLYRVSPPRGSPPSVTFRSSLPSPPASPTRRSSAPKSSSAVAIASSSTTSQRHYCNHSSCLDPQTGRPTKSFSRRADLQRHHACTHESPGLFSCPRPNCIRKGDNGFTRQDHLIEHRRGYHGEQIPKRGSRSLDKKNN